MLSILSQISAWQKHLLVILFLLIVSYAIFLPTLKYEFVADDDELIVDRQEYLKNPGTLSNIFSQQFFVETRDNLPYYRPIITLSFIWDYKMWGLKPFGFHLTNLLFHAINSILVYLLILQLTQKIKFSLTAALFFALHPVHIGTVAWISGRTDGIVTVFFLLSFILMLKAAYHQKATKITYLYYFSGMLSFTAALFSKEIAVVMPLLFLTFIFLKNKHLFKKAFWASFVVFGLPAFFYLLVRHHALGFLASPISGAKPLNIRLLTLPFLFFNYLKTIILATGFDFAEEIIPITSIGSGRFWLYLFILFAFFALIYLLGKKGKALAKFGLMWIFISLLPMLNIIPIASFYSEYWLYIPSIGACIFITCLLFDLPFKKQWIKLILILLISVYLAIITLKTSNIFKNNIICWTISAKKAPNFIIAHNKLGVAYLKQKEHDKARESFENCIKIDPEYGDAYANIATIYMDQKNYEKALEFIEKGANDSGIYRLADFQMIWGVCHFRLGNSEEAIHRFKNTLEVDPQNLTALKGLGELYKEKGYNQLAINYYKKALKITPYPTDAKHMINFIKELTPSPSDSLE